MPFWRHLLLPALAKAKLKARKAECLSNNKQLQMGWIMYSGEHAERMMPNSPIVGLNNAATSWVDSDANGQEGWSNLKGNTNIGTLQSALLAPYMGGQIGVYKCPGDTVPSVNGQRLRSVSMNGQMGGVGESASVRTEDTGALVYYKTTDLLCPVPSDAIIFCDEHPGSINDGYMELDSIGGSWPDVPANYLGGNACGMSFADGHAEVHIWRTAALTSPNCNVTEGTPVNSISAGTGNADWIWWRMHTACKPNQAPGT